MSIQYSSVRFEENGLIGPFRALKRSQLSGIVRRLRAQAAPADWSKGRAVTAPIFHSLAMNERVLDPVRALLGDDVMLWGASIVQRSPGQAHPWHTDIESSDPEGRTISVWIGLANTNAHSSLHVMSRSHRLGKTIQQIAADEGLGRDDVTESHLVEWARRLDPDCELIRPDMSDGDAILFDGRLWHGSDNTNRRGVRTALLLQYASPETPIRIPDPSVLEWPFQFQQRPRPACIMVSGTNRTSVNRMVAPPSRTLRGRGTMVQWIRQLDLPLEGDEAVGWKPYSIFHSPTPTLSDLSCHVSVLEPGRSPHPPHRHDHEEVLIMLSGEARLVIVNAKTGKEETSIVRRGDLIYYPANMLHTIRNDAAEPTTYLMFKWRELSRSRGEALGLELHRANGGPGTAMATGLAAARGFSAQAVLHGPTRYLRALHCHRSILQPGGSYAPHADPYDVAIIVLKGTVETLGERLGPDGVIFYGAGLEHGMQNLGDEPAEYLVFEFHGSRGRSPVIQFGRRALRATIRRAPGIRSLQRLLSSKRKGN